MTDLIINSPVLGAVLVCAVGFFFAALGYFSFVMAARVPASAPPDFLDWGSDGEEYPEELVDDCRHHDGLAYRTRGDVYVCSHCELELPAWGIR